MKQKFILLWPLVHWESGIIRTVMEQTNVVQSKYYSCKFKNCIFDLPKTNSVTNYTKYDAIIFSLYFLHEQTLITIPRTFNQKYIYLFVESTSNFPIRNRVFNTFFNWTMSYRLSSDILIPYVTIYDKRGTFVGPKINMNWIKQMRPINHSLTEKLKSKTKLAAIFTSKCHTKSGRMELLTKLNDSLVKYNQSIDIFGMCGDQSCPRHQMDRCHLMLKRDYFFYLAFENSFSLDYVTEKLLHAVQTYTVPVVYGGADYERFLPPGSYINACSLDPDQLAHKMVTVMSNWDTYFDYLRLHNHYTYVNADDHRASICNLCTALNNGTLVKTTSIYRNFYRWHDVDTNIGCQGDVKK